VRYRTALGLVLALTSLRGYDGQQRETRLVNLNVIAVDSHGQPVTQVQVRPMRRAGPPAQLTSRKTVGLAIKGDYFGHEGSNGSWYSKVLVAPEVDLAVLVACNRGGAVGESAVAATALELAQRYARVTPQ
jgi:hypothetical protein